MTLEPLLKAAPAIQLHAAAAIAALGLGLVQFAAPKGTLPHRAVGWAWVGLMTIVCVSAFFINELRTWGTWGPIHALAVFTLVMLPFAVLHAHRHQVDAHKRAMTKLFLGALVIAGIFTLWPGRIMYQVVSGN